MGQEYWIKYTTNREQVKLYLKAQKFPKDGKTLIIKSDKGKVDCWLSWHGSRLDIASQIFADQSAWCCAIARRLDELFPCDRFGSDSTGWWEKESKPHRPFYFTIKELRSEKQHWEKMQRLFIREAKRLLP